MKSKQHEEVFNFIRACVALGVRPSMREIADRFGISRSHAHRITQTLERDGYLVVVDGPERSRRLWRIPEEHAGLV